MATSRPFAYNTGSLISGTQQFGNLAIGTASIAYQDTRPGGLQWWNGPDEDLGYIIAFPVPGGNVQTPTPISASLRFRRSPLKTDNSFINTVNNFYNQNFTTTTQAYTYLSSSGIYTSYPNLVTSNLIMQLDANNVSSYPGSGSTWFDLSSNNNQGTLINNPTFTSSSPSFFTFNGTNQYVNITSSANVPSGNSQYTLSIWFNPTNFGSGGFIGWGGYGTNNRVTALRFNSNGFVHYWWGNDLAVTLNTMTTNTWYNVVALFNGINRQIYLNGVKIAEDTPTGHNVTITTNVTVGVTNTNEYLNGKIGNVLVYNRGLSSTEVLQNYNVQKTTYGL